MGLSFQEPVNRNYAAVVTTVHAINKLDNCDNVVGIPVFGYQAIVGKDTKIGDKVLVFVAETQLSEEFVRMNNLYRNGDLNSNPERKGYIEQNRRVRAIKFRGHRSDALAMPLSSLSYLGNDYLKLEDNDTFDFLNGHEICRKYEVVKKSINRSELKQTRAFRRVDKKFMPEHYDTDNWFRNSHTIEDDEMVVVTQKLHGTSIRMGHVPVSRKLTWKDKIAKFFGVSVAETEYDIVYGSRRVIKDVNNPSHDHFYDKDIWTEQGRKYDYALPHNYIIYGELVGYVEGNTPIMSHYTYNVPEGQCHLYVYRVALVTHGGRLVDLSWDAVKEFCRENGLNHTPEFFRLTKREIEESGQVEAMMDVRYTECGMTFTEAPIPLSHPDTVDEGICLRVERGVVPHIFKAKSPEFLAHETKLLDADVVDLETSGSTEE